MSSRRFCPAGDSAALWAGGGQGPLGFPTGPVHPRTASRAIRLVDGRGLGSTLDVSHADRQQRGNRGQRSDFKRKKSSFSHQKFERMIFFLK